jgi:predicted phosphodiesterase
VTFLVASDWHLGPASPPSHARLALAFLALARAEGARVVLNGDVFDDLFSGEGRAQAAHPAVVQAIEALARDGRLLRTCGNHDPEGGPERVVLEVPGSGRVLVQHGHQVDPIRRTPAGRLGELVTRRLGRLAVVRVLAGLVEGTARSLAGERMAAVFRSEALALVEREGFALGVFGHVHVPHAVPGDRYANAGALGTEVLPFLELGPRGVRLRALWRARLGPAAEGGSNPAEMG